MNARYVGSALLGPTGCWPATRRSSWPSQTKPASARPLGSAARIRRSLEIEDDGATDRSSIGACGQPPSVAPHVPSRPSGLAFRLLAEPSDSRATRSAPLVLIALSAVCRRSRCSSHFRGISPFGHRSFTDSRSIGIAVVDKHELPFAAVEWDWELSWAYAVGSMGIDPSVPDSQQERGPFLCHLLVCSSPAFSRKHLPRHYSLISSHMTTATSRRGGRSMFRTSSNADTYSKPCVQGRLFPFPKICILIDNRASLFYFLSRNNRAAHRNVATIRQPAFVYFKFETSHAFDNEKLKTRRRLKVKYEP